MSTSPDVLHYRRARLERRALSGGGDPGGPLRSTYRRILAGDLPVVAENDKTILSLNFPISRTCPTRCDECYALRGRMAHPSAVARACATHTLAVRDPAGTAERIARESTRLRGDPLRLCGMGDLSDDLYPLADGLDAVGVPWYGYTRYQAAASRYAPRLLYSVTSATREIPRDPRLALAYARGPEDPETVWGRWIPDVIFPLHGGPYDPDRVPESPRDCPAVRHRVSRCTECRRCYPKTKR